MPRRNRRKQHRTRPSVARQITTKPHRSYQQMAHDLVRAGKASPQILGPMPVHPRREEVAE